MLNEAGGPESAVTALGVVAAPVAGVAERAKALLWPEVDRIRRAGEAMLPGIATPSGLHVFISDDPGETDDWHTDFGVDIDAVPEADGWIGLDHVGIAVDRDQLNEELSFYRTLFGLVPGAVEEFMDPHGRLRSRPLRPEVGDLRIVLNVADLGPDRPAVSGITQLAFGCHDLVAEVRRLRAAGVELMPVPDNYYADLDAKFDLDAGLLAELREHGLLYDRIGDGELLHAYTRAMPGGFCIELLERRGGYDAYGSANTHVRLAAQRAVAAG